MTQPNERPRTGISFSSPPTRGVMIAIDVDPAQESPLPRAMEFFFNPDQVRLVAEASWTKIAIPGLSHEVQQYSHTVSTPLSFNVEWSYLEAAKRAQTSTNYSKGQQGFADYALDPYKAIRQQSKGIGFIYRDFLYSFTVPMERGRAPSRCMLLWPNFLAMICVVNKVDFQFTRWSNIGYPMGFTAGIDLTEHRTVFRQRKNRSNFFTQIDQSAEYQQDSALYDLQKFTR